VLQRALDQHGREADAQRRGRPKRATGRDGPRGARRQRSRPRDLAGDGGEPVHRGILRRVGGGLAVPPHGIVTFAVTWDSRLMSRSPYHGHRFPPVVVQHVVWLYLRFTLSLRDVEDMLAERGLDLSYETVRRWVCQFGPLFARDLRRRPRPTTRWHLDEMVITIAGKRHWLWRAVDDEGEVLDVLVQTRRDTLAASALRLPPQPALQAGGPGALRSCVSSSGGTALRPRRSRPTSWGHTGRRGGNSDCWLAMSDDSAGIIEPRTPTSRRVGEKVRCSGSSRRIRTTISVDPCCCPQHLRTIP